MDEQPGALQKVYIILYLNCIFLMFFSEFSNYWSNLLENDGFFSKVLHLLLFYVNLQKCVFIVKLQTWSFKMEFIAGVFQIFIFLYYVMFDVTFDLAFWFNIFQVISQYSFSSLKTVYFLFSGRIEIKYGCHCVKNTLKDPCLLLLNPSISNEAVI